MNEQEVQRITSYGGALIVAGFLIIILGAAALITMRVFDKAAQGPAAMTVVVLLAFLTAMSIIAAVVVEGQGKEFIALAATGFGALAGAVTGLYGPARTGRQPPEEEEEDHAVEREEGR